MKFLNKLTGIRETFALTAMCFSIFLLLLAVGLGFNSFSAVLVGFEAGVMLGISSLIYLCIRLSDDNNSKQIEKAFIKLDEIANGPNQQTSWNNIVSQKINIVDKRTKGKRNTEVIGEKGETF